MKSEHLTFRYFEQAKRNVFTDLSLSFPEGSVTVLLGASGCGKSTLAAVLCGLYPENGGYLESGSCTIDGEDIFSMPFAQRCRYIAAMFQNPDLQFAMSCLREELYFCLENVSTPPEKMAGIIDERAAHYGVTDLLDRPFSLLSGGEKQKAALVCLMVLHPRVLVLDEPFANLDPDSTKAYLALLHKEIRENDSSIIAIDHKAANWIGIADYFLPLTEECQPALPDALIPAAGLSRHSELLQTLGIEDPFAPLTVKSDSKDAEPQRNDTSQDSLGENASAAETVLRFENVCIYHEKQKNETPPQLQGIDLTAKRGEMIACLGPSGSGKTTFLLSLLKQKPFTGSVRVFGEDLRTLLKDRLFSMIGIVFQNPAIQFVSTSSHKEIAESIRIWKSCSTEEAEKQADEQLEAFGLRHYRRYSPFMLSQGQQRRLGVLAMLAGGQKVLLLDEPTYGQDARTTAAIMKELEEQAAAGTTVIFTTHDRTIALSAADRIWAFGDGAVHELSPEEICDLADAVNKAHTAAPEEDRPYSLAGSVQEIHTVSVPGDRTASSGNTADPYPIRRYGLGHINPTVKAAAILAAALLCAFSFSIPGMLLVIVFCLIGILSACVRPASILKPLIPATIAALTLGISIYKTGNAAVVIQTANDLQGLAASTALGKAAAVSLRIYAYFFLGMTFALTTDNLDFIYSLMQQCRVAPKFAYGVLAAFNLVPQIGRQIRQIRLSYAVRGYHLLPFSTKILFSSLVNAIRWSESLAMAMESKGFEEDGKRTYCRTIRIHFYDWIWAAALIAAAACGPLGLL